MKGGAYAQSLWSELTSLWPYGIETRVGYVFGNRIYDVAGLADPDDEDSEAIYGAIRFSLDERQGIRVQYTHGREEPDFSIDTIGIYYDVSF